MSLFHLHRLDNHDELYATDKEIIVDESFNNGIHDSIYTDLNPIFTSETFPEIFAKINKELQGVYSSKEISKMYLNELLNFVKFFGCSERDLKNLLSISSSLVQQQMNGLTELAYENYRLENFKNVPSRLHCMFACSEESKDYWIKEMKTKKIDVYRIEVDDEPFLTNPSLLPDEQSYLWDIVINSRSYFSPSGIHVDNTTNEYLIKGRVLLKEKVEEIRRK